MSNNWDLVPLGQLLKRQKDLIEIQELEIYKRITIKINGQGIFIRDQLLGSEIGTKKQFIAKKGQLVLSKIDALNGAFGILPEECDNAIITGNFWAFDIDEKLLDATYFSYLGLAEEEEIGLPARLSRILRKKKCRGKIRYNG